VRGVRAPDTQALNAFGPEPAAKLDIIKRVNASKIYEATFGQTTLALKNFTILVREFWAVLGVELRGSRKTLNKCSLIADDDEVAILGFFVAFKFLVEDYCARFKITIRQ